MWQCFLCLVVEYIPKWRAGQRVTFGGEEASASGAQVPGTAGPTPSEYQTSPAPPQHRIGGDTGHTQCPPASRTHTGPTSEFRRFHAERVQQCQGPRRGVRALRPWCNFSSIAAARSACRGHRVCALGCHSASCVTSAENIHVYLRNAIPA